LAGDIEPAAEEIPHLRGVHELVVVIVRPVARPDFRPWLDISKCDEDDVGIIAELRKRRVLKIGFLAVNLASPRMARII
jgi:hypothetical protein